MKFTLSDSCKLTPGAVHFKTDTSKGLHRTMNWIKLNIVNIVTIRQDIFWNPPMEQPQPGWQAAIHSSIWAVYPNSNSPQVQCFVQIQPPVLLSLLNFPNFMNLEPSWWFIIYNGSRLTRLMLLSFLSSFQPDKFVWWNHLCTPHRPWA